MLRALNDVWSELMTGTLATTHPEAYASTQTARNTAGQQWRGVREAVRRVSTSNRGGLWVAGKALRSTTNFHVGTANLTGNGSELLSADGASSCDKGRYLYVIVDKCATFQDMYEIFEAVAERLYAPPGATMGSNSTIGEVNSSSGGGGSISGQRGRLQQHS